MSFSTPIDYFKKDSSPLKIKSSSQSKKSQSKEAMDTRGDVVARTVYGTVESPSCDFEVIAAGNITGSLGSVNTENSVVYCLTGLSVKTSMGQPPGVTFSGESLQAGATVSSAIASGNIAITTRHKAQILDGAFTITGEDCELNECSLDFTSKLSRATVAGETVAHDIAGGKKIVKGKIVQAGATAPEVTAANGYEILDPLTCDNPDEDYATWSFSLVKDVASVEPV